MFSTLTHQLVAHVCHGALLLWQDCIALHVHRVRKSGHLGFEHACIVLLLSRFER